MIPPALLENHPSVQTWIPDNPYTTRDPHFETEAKQVLIIFCPGAVSHVDTFDYKPDLDQVPWTKTSRYACGYFRRAFG